MGEPRVTDEFDFRAIFMQPSRARGGLAKTTSPFELYLLLRATSRAQQRIKVRLLLRATSRAQQ